jgi:hypothetical protein
MDVSGDQEQDRIHLRDLLTCCARSQVSPVRGSESSGVFRSRKYEKEGLGTSFHCNSETRHSKNFASLPQAYPSTPKPSSTSPTAHGMQKPILLSSEPPQRSAHDDAHGPQREGASNPPDLNLLRPAFSLKMSEPLRLPLLCTRAMTG